MSTLKTSPILLFVYNRPQHTRKTIEALLLNRLASESALIIFSDAAKSSAHIESVNEVREYISSVSGFKSVQILHREENYGLARSIIQGVTAVVDEYQSVIVLEDDVVVSPYFLEYMNRALIKYEDQEQVMHISGYMFPVKNDNLPETFFLRTTTCWGWGTWKRAWQFFEKDTYKLLRTFDNEDIYQFNFEGTFDYWDQVKKNHLRKMDTWAVFWYATVFKKKGLCLHPKFSQVSNIGVDGSGVNCGKSELFESSVGKEVKFFEDTLKESKIAFDETKCFFKLLSDQSSYKGPIKRMQMKLLNMFKRMVKQFTSSQCSIEQATNYDPDIPLSSVNTFNRVKEYTMTSAQRIFALCDAVKYVHENRIEGDIVECGVWKGGSMMAVAYELISLQDTARNLYLFDTYDGMVTPTNDDIDVSGEIAKDLLASADKSDDRSIWCRTNLESVKIAMRKVGYPEENIHFVVGKVEDTIPESAPSRIAILRLDTDWYESTKHELEHLFPRLSRGGVLIIDDYGHWLGARKAVDEYLSNNNIKVFLNRIDYTGRLAIKIE